MTRPPPDTGARKEPDRHARIRQRLITLIRQRRREASFSFRRPADLRFAEVMHPESGFPVGEVGAWHLIVDLLESGVPLQQTELEQPPGATAWVMRTTLRGPLYVKMEIVRDTVYLRSFYP